MIRQVRVCILHLFALLVSVGRDGGDGNRTDLTFLTDQMVEARSGDVDFWASIGGVMNLILNRDFQMPADGWYQVAPMGEFAHSAAGVVQVVDREACEAMVERFREEAGVEPFDKLRAERFAGLLVDFDHFLSRPA